MKYYVEESLENFKAWSGALRTLEKLKELGKTEEVERYIEELEISSNVGINDFLRFETDFIFLDLLNYSEEEAQELGLI